MKKYLVICAFLLLSCDMEEKITLKPYSNALIGTSWAKLLGYDVKTGKGYYEIFMFASETEVYLVRTDINKKYTGPVVTCTFKRNGNLITIDGNEVHYSGNFKDYILLFGSEEYVLITT